jgi:ABC-type spermidine/putrescine transport system permease subunit I
MSNEQIRKIIEDSYEESKEEGLRSIVRDFYSRKLLSSAILAWIVAIVFIGLAVYSAVHFFQTDQTRWQIVYAVLFIVGIHEFDVIRVFAWQMVHRHGLRRDIKRLELRVAELSETLKARP